MRRLRDRRWALAAVAAAVVAALVVGVWAPWEDTDAAPAAAAPGPDAPPALWSRRDLRPPAVAMDTPAADPGRELVFLSPRLEEFERDRAAHQQGALVLDDQGRTVWFREAPEGQPITDLRVQRYRGEPVLTWWQGAASEFGIGRGHGVIVDRRYRTIATVQAGNDRTADLHEFLLTPRGTALLTIYSRARRDLSALGGARDAQVTQGIVQEVDVESGRVLFEWRSLDDVAPEESHRPLPEDPSGSYDYFHINSVDEDADGDLLVSARHTSAIYEIDRGSGRVRWRLGGERSDFDLGRGAGFGLQHDARYLDGGVIQVFDNADEATDGEEQEISSVKRLRLDRRRMRASLVERFEHPGAMWAESQGNAVALEDGGVLAGWGSTGAFTRFDAAGEVLLHGHLPAHYDSYRAYLARWDGRPETRPAVHVRREKEQVTVAASWNGATGVDAWQVLAGPGPDRLEALGAPASWAGLETVTVRETAEPYLAVAALDRAGRTLATSAAVEVPEPPPEDP
jgi:hypothetical protein